MRNTRIVQRIIKNKAIGIIYNITPEEQDKLLGRLKKEKQEIIPINANEAYRSDMLKNRLGFFLKVKFFNMSMLPGLLNDKTVITVKGADIIQQSYSQVLEDFSNMRMPLLLLLKDERNMRTIRSFRSYNRVMIIEEDNKV